jgi:uncharacterized protein (TIGR03067 family)
MSHLDGAPAERGCWTVRFREEDAMKRYLMTLALLLLILSVGKGADGPTDLEKLQGRWEIVSVDTGTDPSDPLAAAGDGVRALLGTVMVQGQTVLSPWLDMKARQLHFTVDPHKCPREIDLFVIPADPTVKGSVLRGIYSLEENVFRFCVAHPDQPRPRDFAPRANRQGLVSLERPHIDPDEAILQGLWELDLATEVPNLLKIVRVEDNQIRWPVLDYHRVFCLDSSTGIRAPRLYFRVNSSKLPREIDILVAGDSEEEPSLARGIYSLEEHTLKLCVDEELRPEDFGAAGEASPTAVTLKYLEEDSDEVQLQGIWRGVEVRKSRMSGPLELAILRDVLRHRFEHLGILGEALFSVRGLPSRPHLRHIDSGPMPELKLDFISEFKLDPSKTPKEITVSVTVGSESFPAPGIYELDDHRLEICFHLEPTAVTRPRRMAAEAGDDQIIFVYERCSEAEPRLWGALNRYKQDANLGRMAIQGVVDLYPETESGEEAERFLERIRTWVDVSGRFRVEAEFRGLIGSEIRLRRISDGEIIAVRIEQLSEADQQWIESRRE